MATKKTAAPKRSHTVIDVQIVQIVTEGSVKNDLTGIVATPVSTKIELRCVGGLPAPPIGRFLDGPIKAKLVIEPINPLLAKSATFPDYNRAIACINGYAAASAAAADHLRDAAVCDMPGSAMAKRFQEQAKDVAETGSLTAARLLAFVAEERRPKGMGVNVFQKSFATRNWEAVWELVRVTPTQIVLFGHNSFHRFRRKGLKEIYRGGDGKIFIEESSYDEILKHEKKKTLKLAGPFRAGS